MLNPGTRLGSYEILAPLGAGGMGEVWRARDTRLGREVALKFLPAGFAEDPERHARFEREAKVLASLNHPNIAALYGIEHVDGQHALVMELVEGEGLDERCSRGPVPPDDAITIALQIVDALEAAHEKGIVHRDLKPANVVVRPDGAVKVLDFGLAKAWDAEVESGDPAHSPTITSHHTRAGVILGTASYMSPEQARGKAVDKRADVWAFGCVLFEMLAGRRLFDGETVSDTLASVLKTEVEFSKLPGDVPPALHRLLRRCLEREPRRRLRDIGDARLDLEEARGMQIVPLTRAGGTTRRQTASGRWLPWALIPAVAILGLVAGGRFRRGGSSAGVVMASVSPPAEAEFYTGGLQPGPVSISPDGKRIVFAARDEVHGVRLWLRDLGSANAVPLPGTENGSYPFWSPDGRSIGFFADGKLKRMDSAGGPSVTLCDAPFGKGGTWNDMGVVLFAPSYNSSISQIPAQGGTPVPVTVLDRARNQNSQRFPQFLPDGRHFLFLTRVSGESGRSANEVMLGSLGGGTPKPLVRTDNNAAYASGYLLYTRERVLMARPFDPARLSFKGDEIPVVGDVTVVPAASLAVFTVSRNGVLVYDHGSGGTSIELAWLDREGRRVGTLGPPGDYEEPQLSPDGRRLAVDLQEPTSGRQDIWILGTDRGVPNRFTTGEAESIGPVWLPDGKHLVFRTRAGGFLDLYERALDGEGGNTLLLKTDTDKEATSASPDGRFLAYRCATPGTGFDIWILPLEGGGQPYPFLNSRFDEEDARFSPDGRWIAFDSNESGRNEVYLASFPQGSEKLRVSADGGRAPRWSRDGKELFFLTVDFSTLMAAPVSYQGKDVQIGAPVRLFRAPLMNSGDYDVGNGRFLFKSEQGLLRRSPLDLILNWPKLAEKAVAH